jgi:hypothetical protein
VNFTEAFELSYAKHGGNNLPWEISKDAYLNIFHFGWQAHAESLKQTDMFPGSWDKDNLRPVSLTGQKPDPCSVVTSVQVGCGAPTITAEEIYAFWPVKKARGAAIKAIEKAMKKESPLVLLKAVQELAMCYGKWPVAERQYLPMCSTFFNQERWADDRSTWRKGADAATSQFSKTY